MNMLPLTGDAQETYMNSPKSLDIYYSSEASFLPPGRSWSSLTNEEKRLLEARYRFGPLRPGLYQVITGMRNALD